MIDTIIDLSHHNASVDFAQIRAAGIMAVIHKATQGKGYVDPQYAARRTAAEAAGLLWGAYHFGTGDDPAVQAAKFLAVAGDPASTLLALDFEQNTGGATMTPDQARTFVAAVRAKAGRWPVLYTGSAFFRQQVPDKDATFGNCPLWLAQYGSHAIVPASWNSWTLWQYSDGTTGGGTPVAGVGKCDRSRFNGDAAALQAFWPGALVAA